MRASPVTRATRAESPAAASPSGNDLSKGLVVVAEDEEGRALLLALTRPDGKTKWLGCDSAGASHSIRPKVVLCTLPLSDAEWRSLGPLRAQADALLQALPCEAVETSWELVQEGGGVQARDLAELLFSSADAPAVLAAHSALLASPWFRREGGPGCWAPRTRAAVEQLRLKEAAERAAEAQRDAFRAAWQAASQASPPSKPERESWERGGDGTWRRWVRALEACALDTERLDELDGRTLYTPQDGAAVLGWLEGGSGRAPARPAAVAVQQLVSAGRWSLHENTAALRARLPLAFTGPLLAAADELLSSPPADVDSGSRSDLTRLRAFTIDGPDTTEFDDALSVEALGGGRTRVWVHIADPTRWLPLGAACAAGDTLDAEAFARGSSVYFPTGSVPMFPGQLAAGPMSLRAGGPSCALSIAAELADDGSLLDAFVVPSTIQVTYRLTYEGAEELLSLALAEEPELQLLAQAARARAAWRTEQGAVHISMPETVVRVSGADVRGGGAEASVSVSSEQPQPPGCGARNLVAELMVLAGDVVARIAGQAQLPFPFRAQLPASPLSALELDALPAGPCRAVAIRGRMTPSFLSPTPQRHSALGLEAYAQVTSPIRRYTDLLAHHQLKAHLRGHTPPFNAAQMSQRAEIASAMGSAAQRCGREGERYWVGVWFQRQPKDSVFTGVCLRWLREDLGLVSVLLDGLGLEVAAIAKRDMRPGDQIALACTASRPRENVLQFKEVAYR